jgi:hypothetical protein
VKQAEDTKEKTLWCNYLVFVSYTFTRLSSHLSGPNHAHTPPGGSKFYFFLDYLTICKHGIQDVFFPTACFCFVVTTAYCQFKTRHGTYKRNGVLVKVLDVTYLKLYVRKEVRQVKFHLTEH